MYNDSCSARLKSAYAQPEKHLRVRRFDLRNRSCSPVELTQLVKYARMQID